MFELDLRSRLPIYEQLVEKIKELIICNVLKADEKLPTIRELASELSINPNTIQKAYRELEHRAYIYTVPGKGNFVSTTIVENNTLRLSGLRNDFRKLVAEMLYLGIPKEDLIIQINLISNGEGGTNND